MTSQERGGEGADVTVQQVRCPHEESGRHWFEHKYIENRSIWNPFWARCTKCGVSIQEVIDSIPAMLDQANRRAFLEAAKLVCRKCKQGSPLGVWKQGPFQGKPHSDCPATPIHRKLAEEVK